MQVVGQGAGERECAAEPDRENEFETWVTPHWEAMARLALRLVGEQQWEDVLQEALVLAWRKWHRFDASRGTPRTWLLTLTADQARRTRRKRRLVAAPAEIVQPHKNVEAFLDLDRAIESLASRQRLAVELYYFVGLSVEETAQVMGCAPGTVKSTLSDARVKLRATLKDDADDQD